MSTLGKIKEACRNANPDKQWEWDCSSCRFTFDRDYTLADVLLAIKREKLFEKVYPTRIIQSGYKATNLEMIYELWNLKDDNLENQSEELKQFVADLL